MRWILLFLLISCTEEEDMRLFTSSLSGITEAPPPTELNEAYIRSVTASSFNSFDSAPSVNANDYSGTDNEKIQSAISAANAIGKCNIVIDNTIQSVWMIDEAIQLDSYKRLILDGVKIKKIDLTQNNFIRQSGVIYNAVGGIGCPAQSVPNRNDIHIYGLNGAQLEEADIRAAKRGWSSISVLIAKTSIFSIRGIEIINSLSFQICLQFESNLGYIKDIIFNSTDLNTDGTHVSKSTYGFVIEDLSGTTGDDTTPINGFLAGDREDPVPNDQSQIYIEGNYDYYSMSWTATTRKTDIHHVYTYRVHMTYSLRGFRILVSDGIRAYNIELNDYSSVQYNNGAIIESGIPSYNALPSPDGSIHDVKLTDLTNYNRGTFDCQCITENLTATRILSNFNQKSVVKTGQINFVQVDCDPPIEFY